MTFSGTSLAGTATTKVSAITNPFAGQTLQPWVPTAAERSALGHFIPFADAGAGDGGP